MWSYRQYGSAADAVHKSHLNTMTGPYGCMRRFRFERDEALAEQQRAPAVAAPGRMVAGTAVHETIARALANPAVREPLLHYGELPSQERIRATFEHELRVAADGRPIDWNDEPAEQLIAERCQMIEGLLASLPHYVADVVLVEPGFCAELDGVHLAGHIDLVYRPRDDPKRLALADWKTGKSKPHTIELTHSWEAGIYSHALHAGQFLPRESVQLERLSSGQWRGTCVGAEVLAPSRWLAERLALEAGLARVASGESQAGQRLGEYPLRVHYVHLQDFVPYKRGGSKKIERDEDLAYYRKPRPCSVKYEAGQRRGPAWLPIALREDDTARLAYRLRTVIGTVRMGRFIDTVNEQCQRCPFARDCLNEGYSARGDELQEVETALRRAGL